MASQDVRMAGSELPSDQQKKKKTERKADRACDFCRKRKSRCDGDQRTGKACANCSLNDLKCTYELNVKRQVISKAYVESLERRIEELESMLGQQAISPPQSAAESPSSNIASPSSPVSQEQLRELYWSLIRDDQRLKRLPYRNVSPETIEDAEDAAENQDEINPQDDDLNDKFQQLRVGPKSYQGKSSPAHLVMKIIQLKKKGKGDQYPPTFLDGRRPRFWQPHPWEYALLSAEPANYQFPEGDLMQSLIDLYCDNIHLYFPILHVPTLLEGMRADQHHRDHNFGAIVLLVCALGALFSEDPRVLSEDYASDTHSRGWKWFVQAEKQRRPIYTSPTLHEMQSFCLSILFMVSASKYVAQHIWLRLGTGIRYIQDTGAHRRTTRKIPTNTDEMWNRAVWLLIVLDRYLSSAFGRPTAIQDEVFDIRYPMECDDEYWYNPDDPEGSWKQPTDKPSMVSCFVTYIKLSRVVEIALRSIYSTNKYSVIRQFMGEGWERNVVRELDSALNKWLDDVPKHVRWNPEQPDVRLLNQAAYLHSIYRQTQILIHRPFITSSELASQFAVPSLTICTTAARACAHVMDQQRRITGKALPFIMFAASTSAIVLLVSMFGRVQGRTSRDQLKELKEVHLMMDYLKSLEDNWVTAGRTWDILNDLCYLGDMPNSQLGKHPRKGPDAEQHSRNGDVLGFRGRAPPQRHVFRGASSPSAFTSPASTDSVNTPQSLDHMDMPASSNTNGRKGDQQSHMGPTHGMPSTDDVSAWFPPEEAGAMELGGMTPLDFSQPAWMLNAATTTTQRPIGLSEAATNDLSMQGLDQDSMAIWSSIPAAFDTDDWMTYLTGLAEVAHEHNNPQPSQDMGPESAMSLGGANFPL